MSGDNADLLAAFPLPALLIRPDERIAAANAAALQVLGPRIEGRHFITAIRQPQVLDAIDAARRDDAMQSTEYLTNDGRQDMTYRVTARSVPMTDGRGVLVTFEDRTHLEHAVQMRRDFVANVSHELRTPLTAMIGFIETLLGPAKDDPEGRERFLAIMQTEANRMNRLVKDLLSLSRVEATERVRPTEEVDLTAVIRSTLHGLTPIAREHGVTLDVDLPEDEPRVIADHDQLCQLVSNLVENAIKYSGQGAEVTVSLTAPEYQPRLRRDGVCLTVADTGPGIDPVQIPRLTERFYRIDNHRSREMGGTGLGLAIVKHIVNRHRGRLRIESAPGEGSRFSVLLPLDQTPTRDL
ncbi:MAG: ATP-binding protein [Paracoccaceae bacterium]|nr:ATP-binding protein [Paracoccaceae bacterium]